MSSKFTAPLIFSSALALGAMGFVACGEDSNPGLPPNSQPTVSSSSYVEPVQTPTTAIVFSNLDVASATTSRVKFQGSISLDLSDENTVADINAVVFTGLDIVILKAGTQIQQGTATFTNPVIFPTNATINLLESGLQTDLEEGYTECGDFELVITAYADDGFIQSVTTARIPFTRSEENCKEPESSSSAPPDVPGAPLKMITIKDFNTKINRCINLTTESISADETGDICITKTISGTLDLSSTNGLKFAVYDNKNVGDRKDDYSKNYRPENRKDRPNAEATTDDFLYVENALTETYTNFTNEDDKFFVAIGPDFVPYSGSATGFYAFIVTKDDTAGGNEDHTLTLDIYKAK